MPMAGGSKGERCQLLLTDASTHRARALLNPSENWNEDKKGQVRKHEETNQKKRFDIEPGILRAL